MAETKIEWCDVTWSPVTGCSPISEGCLHCYAKRMANRLKGRYGYPADEPFRPTFHPDRLDQPLRWKKPRRIFVCSMGDLFHSSVPDEWIDHVFEAMADASQHTFLLLTKRPDRMLAWFNDIRSRRPQPGWGWCTGGPPFRGRGYPFDADVGHCGTPWPLPNVWLGTTCENQARAEERIPLLLQTPATLHFLSYEPGLGPLDLAYLRLSDRGERTDIIYNALTGRGTYTSAYGVRGIEFWGASLDWVICGGESGPGARPMHPDWARALRNQCVAAGTPCLFKQWGEWAHWDQLPDEEARLLDANGHGPAHGDDPDEPIRVGKKHAGRLLDGQLWDQYPEVK